MDNVFTNNIKFKGEPCVKMSVGNYTCIIAPRIGGNCLRLYDSANNIELVNFDPKIPMKWIKSPSILVGIPSLLFPNRLCDGILKTSDAQYTFPINETSLNNYIHGFIHSRHYRIVSCEAINDVKIARTTLEYVYDDKDTMFQYFPVSFTINLIYTLSNDGLTITTKITNHSDKMMPIGLGCHTSMRAPFAKMGKKKNIRIKIPVIKRVELDDRFLSTGNFLELSEEDALYNEGKICPVLHDINNHMFEIGTTTSNLGKQVHGIVMSDIKKRKSILYEVDDFYRFFILWNCGGNTSFFCPEPISWMINAPNIDLPNEVTGYRELAPNATFETWQKLSSECY